MKRPLTWLAVALCVGSLLGVELVSGLARTRNGDLVPAAWAQGRGAGPAPDKGCSNRTLRGTFGFSFSGTAVIPGFKGKPGAVVGLMTFDGQGNLTAVVTASANGTILRGEVAGTYAVNPDCSGSVTAGVVPVPRLTFQCDGVIVNGGTEVLFIGTIAEIVFSGVAKKL